MDHADLHGSIPEFAEARELSLLLNLQVLE
jgi:hypothetical protein